MSVKDKIDAFDKFVRTLKADSLWDDIGTAAILAGWTNVNGCKTALKGVDATNNGFADADVDAGIGMKGNGSTKYLNSNRANNADGQNDNHLAAYVTSGSGISGFDGYLAGTTHNSSPNSFTLCGYGMYSRDGTSSEQGNVLNGLCAISRNAASQYSYMKDSGDVVYADTNSVSGDNRLQNHFVFAYANPSYAAAAFVQHRLSYYSIGSATDLASLDTAVSTLMTDLRSIDEQGMDRDALRYVRAVEAADGSFLETPVKRAINALVEGLKQDTDANGRSAWDAIGASCLLCGPRTLSGALVPLRGDAPTNVADGFVSGDYDRSQGLVGDGSTTYLDSGRANDADAQNDQHMATYATAVTNGTTMGVGALQSGITRIGRRNPSGFTNTLVFRSQTNTGVTDKTDAQWTSGLAGVSRSQADSHIARSAGTNLIVTADSQVPYSQNSYVFCRNSDGAADDFAASGLRLAFYSIGASLSLESLDRRISDYVTAIAAAL